MAQKYPLPTGTKFIVVFGGVGDRLEFVGPFDDFDVAHRYIDDNGSNRSSTWSVIPLENLDND